jgi:hypothetical protein
LKLCPGSRPAAGRAGHRHSHWKRGAREDDALAAVVRGLHSSDDGGPCQAYCNGERLDLPKEGEGVPLYECWGDFKLVRARSARPPDNGLPA